MAASAGVSLDEAKAGLVLMTTLLAGNEKTSLEVDSNGEILYKFPRKTRRALKQQSRLFRGVGWWRKAKVLVLLLLPLLPLLLLPPSPPPPLLLLLPVCLCTCPPACPQSRLSRPHEISLALVDLLTAGVGNGWPLLIRPRADRKRGHRCGAYLGHAVSHQVRSTTTTTTTTTTVT